MNKFKRLFLLSFFVLNTIVLFAQNEASVWYFGRFAGLDFRNGPPMLLRDGEIETNEGCSTISDSNGNLLFYTNGSKVWNKNHDIMVNGEGLFGHWSSTNSSIIIPKPNSPNIYYLVTLDEPSYENTEFYPNPNPEPLFMGWAHDKIAIDDGLNNGLNYSIIDMSLNGGLGEVISKNNHLVTYDQSDVEQKKYKCSEKLTAIYNTDGTAIWFLTHFMDKFYVFKVDETGIDTTPIVSPSGYTIPLSGYTTNGIGAIKFSPNGKKLALANLSDGDQSEAWDIGNAYLFDFDNMTGVVSNGVKLLEEGHPYGVEFSPSSEVLYVNVKEDNGIGQSSNLYQFDLTSSDIVNSKYLARGSQAGALQLGIDGIIYISMPDLWHLSRVVNPNIYGSGVEVTWFDVYLDGFNAPYRRSVFGLPSFIQTNFEQNITFKDLCLGSDTSFNLINNVNIDSVIWGFGDILSGSNNVSTELEPIHTYATAGIYEVTATIKSTTGIEKIVKRKLEIMEVPIAYSIEDIHVCAQPNSSYPNWVISFPAGHVEEMVLGGQVNRRVTYDEGGSAEYGDPISELGTRAVFGQETITVRVAQKYNPTCYDETTFNVIVEQGAQAYPVNDIYACDNDDDGYAEFDLSLVDDLVVGNQIGVNVDIYDEEGNLVILSNTDTYINTTPFRQTLIARINDMNVDCYQERSFNIITETNPIVNILQDIIGCDEDNDGISEYFDTSNVEELVLGGQTGMEVSYYDSMGNFLSNTLANPYSNTIPNKETITVRVTNTLTSCYAETQLILKTSIKPQINTPQDIYACDEGNGISTFDLSTIENEIIGSQTGLNIYYFDAIGNELTSMINSNFQNIEPWRQTIYVKVENASNNLCFSEISFNLIIDKLPQVDIQGSYFLCNLEPSLPILMNASFDAWEWKFEDGSVISNSNEANLINAGDYELTVTEFANGKTCENTFNFELVRSVLPTIINVEYQELTDDNYIKINASGDGDFEYSIGGDNFQNSNYFDDLLGGVYDVYVRDIYGCGEDTQQITIVDFPKYFTPNGDGVNDDWQIKGIESFSKSEIFIYDRYGKLLKQLNPSSKGWDGTFNGKMLPSDDYWFKVLLDDGREFMNHFTLKR